jgi:YnbE-like lipoprotein
MNCEEAMTLDHGRIAISAALGCGLGVLLFLTGACTPRVEVATDKPITINLNVKIDHEIRVKVDKDLDQVLSHNSGLF